MKMVDFTVAFPKRVLIDPYLPIIDGATKAVKGADGLPRVVQEEYDNHKLATKAANAIRNYSKNNNLELRVSLPDNSNTISVYKGKAGTRKAKKNEAAKPPADNGVPKA